MPETKVITGHFGTADLHTLAVYRSLGGYETLAAVLHDKTPDETIEVVKKSRLRGRGGAGFPTGLKWSFLDPDLSRPRYFVVNADEGEPGAFKDRQILERDPHQLLEGLIISCFAARCHTAYIYIRGEFDLGRERVQSAIAECRENNLLGEEILGTDFNLQVHVHSGAGSYVCGDETALLDSLEGKRGYPRNKPPFPAVKGAFGSPTVVNNVETVAYVGHILRRGAEWFARAGVGKSTGFKIFTISGDVQQPGFYEYELGCTLRQLIYESAGGMRDGRAMKACFPGGSSAPPLGPEHLDIPMTFETLAEVGSMLGSGSPIVIAEGRCMVEVMTRLGHFYTEETCGQCTPCREGVPWLTALLERLERGHGTSDDLALIPEICDNIENGNTICALGPSLSMPVRTALNRWREEFEAHVSGHACPYATRPDALPRLDLK